MAAGSARAQPAQAPLPAQPQSADPAQAPAASAPAIRRCRRSIPTPPIRPGATGPSPASRSTTASFAPENRFRSGPAGRGDHVCRSHAPVQRRRVRHGPSGASDSAARGRRPPDPVSRHARPCRNSPMVRRGSPGHSADHRRSAPVSSSRMPSVIRTNDQGRLAAVTRASSRRCEAAGQTRCSCPPSNFTRSPMRRSSMRWKSKSRTLPLSKRTWTR